MTAAPPRHTNRLAKEESPYLLQHAHNPVEWYPWGEEAIEKARREDKPIFLSVGYATCHWCHVMERESFESEAIAVRTFACGAFLSWHVLEKRRRTRRATKGEQNCSFCPAPLCRREKSALLAHMCVFSLDARLSSTSCSSL